MVYPTLMNDIYTYLGQIVAQGADVGDAGLGADEVEVDQLVDGRRRGLLATGLPGWWGFVER